MADIHITRELLRAVSSGDLPPRILFEIGFQNLNHGCPHCRGEADLRGVAHLATLARTVIHYSPAVPGTFDVIALSTAYLANACRAAGDLEQAGEHFSPARYVVTHGGVTEPKSWPKSMISKAPCERISRASRKLSHCFCVPRCSTASPAARRRWPT